MYYFTQWDVLIVDDEADVLTFAQLVLADFEVYGLPLALHTAQSQAQAINLLQSNPDLATNLALAFLDVVMETDAAGLELCNFLREEIGNRLTQIFIRTGQPGLAPEKTVIDQYEINGYFTKLEVTEEKLYSVVKIGVRQFLWSHMAQTYLAGISEVLSALHWRQKIAQLLLGFAASIPNSAPDFPLYIAFENHPLVAHGVDDEQVAQWLQKRAGAQVMTFTLDGNYYVRASEHEWGIHIMGTPNNAKVVLICQTAFAPPDDLVAMTHDFLLCLATLWKHAI